MQNEDDLYKPLFDAQQLTKLWKNKKFKKTTNVKTKMATEKNAICSV